MVSSFTTNKRIEQPAFNDYIDSWDVPVNADWGIIDVALGGVFTLNATGLSGNQVLTATQYQPLKIRVTGLPIGATNVRIPSAVGGIWVVRNDTTGGFAITIDSAAGGAAITIPVGQNTLVTCDGTALGMFAAINTPGTAAGSNTQVQFNSAGVLGGSANLTFDGTTLSSTGLTTTGNTILGDAAGDTLTINGTAVTMANGIAVNTNQLFLNSAGTKVAVGTITPGTSMFTVAGTIESTAGGFVFPDGSVQTTTATSPTGTILDYIGVAAPATWVLANGKTIGNAASSATGRANADCSPLFVLIWNNWANAQAAVSGGRGANAAADFAANKTIALPDLRGRVVAGIDTMDNTNAGRLANTISAVMGNAGGQDVVQYAYSGSASVTVSVVVSGSLGVSVFGTTGTQSGQVNVGSSGVDVALAPHTHDVSSSGTASGALGGSGSGGGSSSGVTDVRTNVQPTMVMSKIIKL